MTDSDFNDNQLPYYITMFLFALTSVIGISYLVYTFVIAGKGSVSLDVGRFLLFAFSCASLRELYKTWKKHKNNLND